MRALLACLLLLAACGAPKVDPPPPLPEAPDYPDCIGPAEVGMEPEEIESLCGPPDSKIYAAAYPTAMAFKYCVVPSCRVAWVFFFYDGTVKGYGTVYEIVP